MPFVALASSSAVFTWIIRYFSSSILLLLFPKLKGLAGFKRVSLNVICHHAIQETDPP